MVEHPIQKRSEQDWAQKQQGDKNNSNKTCLSSWWMKIQLSLTGKD